MPAKNYYLVLGVPRGASYAGIRAAYHELARLMHPDVTGPSGTSRFQEINEAYEVLSDPDRRRAHDREFDEPDRGMEVPVRRQPPGWPIRQPEQTRSSLDGFRDFYLRNVTGWSAPNTERAESLTLDVVLSSAEALYGCTVPVGIPVLRPCLRCGGQGYVFRFRCPECSGSGFAEARRNVLVRVPPQVQPGTVLEVPLSVLGSGNLYLRLRISLSDLW